MDLAKYVERLRGQLLTAAEIGGDENREAIERLAAGLEAATRVVLLETVSAASDEITAELAPGAVEVRLRGSDPEFVVTQPSDTTAEGDATAQPLSVTRGGEDTETARLNLRLPETLKTRIEEAARGEGLSLNTWLVRTAAAAVEGAQGQARRPPSGSQRYTGWVR